MPDTVHKLIRSAVLNGQGSASWSLSPDGHTSLYAVADGVCSTVSLLRVARTITLGVRQASGGYRFSGVANRPAAGLQVTLARVLSTGRVVGVGSTRTNAAGAYALTSRLRPGTNPYYVLTAPTADLLAGRSRAYGLAVPGQTTRRAVSSAVPGASYANCTALRQTYPHGIGRVGAADRTSGTPVTTWTRDTAGYDRATRANSDLDRDRDAIACEQR